MNNRRGRPPLNPASPPPPSPMQKPDPEFSAATPMIDSETASALEELMGLDDPSYRSILYKYEGWNGDLKNIVWQTSGVLSQTMVADKLGPGRYYLRVRMPDGKAFLSSTIRVDPDYVRNVPVQNAVAVSSRETVDLSPFAAIREAVSLLGELSAILERNRPVPQSLPEQMTGLMGTVMGMTTNVMQQAVETNAKMVTESQKEINALRKSFREQLEDREGEYDDAQETIDDSLQGDTLNGNLVPSELEQKQAMEQELYSAAVEAISPHIEKLISSVAGEQVANFVAGHIRSTELYKQLVKNPGALDRVKGWAIETVGADQAAQFFTTLKI